MTLQIIFLDIKAIVYFCLSVRPLKRYEGNVKIYQLTFKINGKISSENYLTIENPVYNLFGPLDFQLFHKCIYIFI